MVTFPGERNGVKQNPMTYLIEFLKRSGEGGRADNVVVECHKLASPREKLQIKAY